MVELSRFVGDHIAVLGRFVGDHIVVWGRLVGDHVELSTGYVDDIECHMVGVWGMPVVGCTRILEGRCRMVSGSSLGIFPYRTTWCMQSYIVRQLSHNSCSPPSKYKKKYEQHLGHYI